MALPPWWPHVRTAVLLLAVGGSLVAAHRLWTRTGEDPLDLRRRFVLGVPWGTLATIGGLVLVYLFVQGGVVDYNRPIVLPFRAWSYFYPLGLLTAAFTHNGFGHLLSNSVGTLVFGGIVEYAIGHYPGRRGASSFASWRTNPYVRALVVPGAAVGIGLFTALFSLGPVIGFSGVVFAFAGVALVNRPLATAFGLLAASVVGTTIAALQSPQVVADPSPTVGLPWWAQIAVQDHAIGLILGVVFGVALARRRDVWPSPRLVWFAGLAFVITEGVWAIYLPLSGGRFVLYRWLGVALAFVLALLIAAAAARVPTPSVSLDRASVPDVAVVVLLLALLALSVPAVPYNVAPTDQQPAPEPAIEVRGYQVGYAENVPDGYLSAVSVPGFGDARTVTTSGVVVTNPDRYVWETRISRATLANQGRSFFTLGGVGWREIVVATRTGWSVVGNRSVYAVSLNAPSAERTRAFESGPSTANPTIASRNVTLEPTADGFDVRVTQRNRTLGTAPLPTNGTGVAVGGLTVERSGDTLYGRTNGTRVAVAHRQN